MRRRRRDIPLQRSGLPGVLARSLALEHAPNEIEVEDQLHRDRCDRRYRYEHHERMQILQIFILSKLRKATRHADQAHNVHRHEDAVHANERDPEVQLTESFIHHAAKHLREPEIGGCKHAEDRSNTHHEMKVSQHDIGVM